MNRKIISVSAIFALAMTSPAALAVAQAPGAPPKASATTTSFSAKPAGPTVEATKVGVRQSSASSKAAAPYEARLGAGRNIALMVVGGAALIIGAVIGGAAGVLVAVAGAAVGLYGLYYFVQ